MLRPHVSRSQGNIATAPGRVSFIAYGVTWDIRRISREAYFSFAAGERKRSFSTIPEYIHFVFSGTENTERTCYEISHSVSITLALDIIDSGR